MGTLPIFESDFDCLTVQTTKTDVDIGPKSTAADRLQQ